MTDELLSKAKTIQKNIQDIQSVLNSIERIKLIDKRQKENRKPILRFVNAFKRKNGKEMNEATVFLFDGINAYGTDIPVDDRLLDYLKKYYQQRLEETKMEFESL